MAVVDSQPDGSLLAHVVTVGDSGAWVLEDETLMAIQGGKGTSGVLTSSAVAGLPKVPKEIAVSTVEIAAGAVLLLGTDGFGDPVGDGSGEVGALFRDSMRAGRVPSLHEFAHKLDFSRETFDDDRTLVAIWPSVPTQAEADSDTDFEA